MFRTPRAVTSHRSHVQLSSVGKKTQSDYEMKTATVTVVNFAVCGFFSWFDLASDWSRHNEHSKNNYWCSAVLLIAR